MKIRASVFLAAVLSFQSVALFAQPSITVTHGPMLGRLTSSQVAVWARTSAPGTFKVRFGESPDALSALSSPVTTVLDRDNTGSVLLGGLKPGTTYFYQVVPQGAEGMASRPDGSFMTLPDPQAFANPEHNPRGLFNFRFEFGTGNNQNPSGPGPWPPAFKTMLDTLKGKVHFSILNGDFIYEEKRELKVDEWRKQVGLDAKTPLPPTVDVAPTIVGVWENYKLYLERGAALSAWHRNVPAFFTFDDHEILDNVEGTSTVGNRERRAVFRDIGTQAWYDYLGWANPATSGPIHFGRAQFKAGNPVLTDPRAAFGGSLAFGKPGALHVHWGGPHAGLRGRDYEALPPAERVGDPNAGVYRIDERLDANRLKISPAPKADGTASYSIGRNSYYEQRVGNAHFFFLDTRGFRDIGDVERPERADLSMLGAEQKAWLKEGMRKSDADVLFVISQVTLMVPHVGGTATGGGVPAIARPVTHDEAWPVFLAEREELIDFWDKLGKTVLVLTGDLHNSFAIKVTDRVWELASGPHNSRNHRAEAEGFRPPNGVFESRGRKSDIRWSSYFLSDMPANLVRQPIYTVVQMNNVFNNPIEAGKDRWVAYPHPQVVVQYFNGFTGDLLYAEAIRIK